MGRYVDSEGYVWQGPVHCCYECYFWTRGPEERKGCAKFGKEHEVFARIDVRSSDENNCPDWRPGD